MGCILSVIVNEFVMATVSSHLDKNTTLWVSGGGAVLCCDVHVTTWMS